MKVKATIVLITVLSGLLVACNADPDGSVVTTAIPVPVWSIQLLLLRY